MVYQLCRGVPAKVLEKEGLGAYYSDHDHAVYPVSASGVPFTAAYIQSKGDPIADLTEDLAAEQKARATYENLINLADDPDVIDPLRFLREREIVHFQRFGEALRIVQDKLAQKAFYMQKPVFDNAAKGANVGPTEKGAGVSPTEKGAGVSPTEMKN